MKTAKIILAGGIMDVSNGRSGIGRAIAEWAEKIIADHEHWATSLSMQTIEDGVEQYFIVEYECGRVISIVDAPEELIPYIKGLFDAPDSINEPISPESEANYKQIIHEMEEEIRSLRASLYEVGEIWGQRTREVMKALGFDLVSTDKGGEKP